MTELQRVAVVGMGLVVGPHVDKTIKHMEAEAARLAIEDAGLKRSDITAAIRWTRQGARAETPSVDSYARILGLPVTMYYVVGRGCNAAHAMVQAAAYLSLGLANYVVLVGAQNLYSAGYRVKQAGGLGKFATDSCEGYWGPEFGADQPASNDAMVASRYIHEFGALPEHFGAVAVQTRAWANKNPLARFYDRTMSMDDYLASPMVIEPYRLFDLSVNSDAAVGVVLTTEERAQEGPNRPVYLLGAGFGDQQGSDWWDKTNYTRLAVKTAKEDAFRLARLALEDIDVALLYDCFTVETLLQLEDYGWCGKGEAGPFVAEGRIGPGGDIAVNTGGGLLSSYHIADFTGLSEAMLQLTGRAGERQLQDCRTALVTGHGGSPMTPSLACMHAAMILGNEIP